MTMTLKPLKRTRLYEEIVRQILDMIKDKTLKPGDRLPSERKLCELLGVSRTAIREALRSLESMGYIQSNVGGGTFVRAMSIENIVQPFATMLSQDEQLMLDLIEVRMLLETEMASRCALHRTAQDIEDIRATLIMMEKEIDAGENGIDGDTNFHRALAKAAGNTAMSYILEMCGEWMTRSRSVTLEIPGQPQKSLLDHHEILAAIEKADAKAAARAMKRHLQKAYHNIETRAAHIPGR